MSSVMLMMRFAGRGRAGDLGWSDLMLAHEAPPGSPLPLTPLPRGPRTLDKPEKMHKEHGIKVMVYPMS